MPAPPINGTATCSEPAFLPLVDAAYDKPGGPEAQQLKQLCRHCPVNTDCHAWAMTHGEAGIWGGLSPQVRASRGAPPNLEPVHRNTPTKQRPARGHNPIAIRRETSKSDLLLTELGMRRVDVKRWALDQGLVTSIHGRVALTVVQAWATAHGRTATPNP